MIILREKKRRRLKESVNIEKSHEYDGSSSSHQENMLIKKTKF